jgi:hypothetical protein
MIAPPLRTRRAAAGSGNRLDGFLGAGGVAGIADDHVHAVRGKAFGCYPADAAGTTRDDGDAGRCFRGCVGHEHFLTLLSGKAMS